MLNKVLQGSIRTLCQVFLVIMIALSVAGLFLHSIKFGIVVGAALAVFMASFFVISNKFSSDKNKWLWLFFIGLGILLRVAYAFTVDIEIKSDQLNCLNAAQQTVLGDFSWTADKYFVNWAYQIPFVLYESLILKLFGTTSALYVFNGLFSVATCLLIYLIVKKIYSTNVALITTAVFSCFPLFIFSIRRLYNQIIAGFFLLLAVYFFVCLCSKPIFKGDKKEFIRSLLLCLLTGISLGISNLFRTEAVIGLLACVCWFIYSFAENFKEEKFSKLMVRTLLCIAVIFCSYKFINAVVDYSVIHSGISPYGIKNGCVYWFIVCGLTPETYGNYSPKYQYITDYQDPDQQYEVFKAIMADIFNGKSFGDILMFFVKKDYYMWGEIHNFAKFNESYHIPGFVKSVADIVNHCVYILVMALAAIGVRKKNFNSVIAFLAILFIGFYLAFIIKEISPVYRYSTLLVLTVLSSSGINGIINSEIKLLKSND